MLASSFPTMVVSIDSTRHPSNIFHSPVTLQIDMRSLTVLSRGQIYIYIYPPEKISVLMTHISLPTRVTRADPFHIGLPTRGSHLESRAPMPGGRGLC